MAEEIQKSQTQSVTKFAVKENILNQYDTSTYHFRLYMVSPIYFMDGKTGPEAEQIILAESGCTAIGIDEVTFTTVHGYESSVEGSGTATKFDITLTQPFNADLYDRMYSASLALGIPNYSKCPYFLELYFLGNDPETSQPTLISGLKWTWMLQVLNVSSEITSNGSKYSLSAVDVGDMAFSDQACVLQEASVVNESAATVKDALQGLVENLEVKQKLKGNVLVRDEWVINVVGDDADELKNSRIVPAEQQKSTSRQNDLHFTDGTSIQKAIDEILANSHYFQEKAKTSRDKLENKYDKDDIKDKVFKSLPKIIPHVDIIDYDPLRGDYARRYTYNIAVYKISTVLSSPEEGALSKEEIKERVHLYINHNKIVKHYNYLFTGKNTEVYNFDLKFKTAWYVSLPRKEGKYTSANVGVGERAKDEVISFSQKKVNELNNIVAPLHKDDSDNINKTEAESIKNIQKIIDKKKEEINKNNAIVRPDEKANALKSNEELAKDIIKLEDGIQSIKTGKLTVDNVSSSTLRLAKGYANGERIVDQMRPDPSKNPFKKYVEDFEITNTNSYDKINSKRRLPISFVETNEDEMVAGIGGINSSNEDKVLYSALFAQGNRSMGSDLIRVEIHIKGDPFWLGQSKLKNGTIIPAKEMIENESRGENIDQNLTTHYTRENYFLFTTQTPDSNVILSEEGASFSRSSMINGIYGVIMGKHTFNGGKFTSVLTAVIESVSDVRLVDIENYLANGTQNPDKPEEAKVAPKDETEKDKDPIREYKTTKAIMEEKQKKQLQKQNVLTERFKNAKTQAEQAEAARRALNDADKKVIP